MIEIKQVKTENQELYGFVEELMHRNAVILPNSVSIRTVIPFSATM